jgi:hypothetical protein
VRKILKGAKLIVRDYAGKNWIFRNQGASKLIDFRMDLNLKGTFSELRVANSSWSSSYTDNRKGRKTKVLFLCSRVTNLKGK